MAQSRLTRVMAKRAIYIAVAACVVLSVLLAYMGRSSRSSAAQASTKQTPLDSQQQLKHWAEKTAAPLIEELKETPQNVGLLVRIGNIYCDAHQFEDCIQYYERALKVDSRNADVRADLANAYYYAGDADRAIVELSRVVREKPNHANALFNLGMVRWQAKRDSEGAVLAWQELLRRHPDFALKQQVKELIAKAQASDTPAGRK